MHMSSISPLARNSEGQQSHVHPTRARRFGDHLTGDRARNTRVGDIGNTWLRHEERADQAGATPNRPGAKLNGAFKQLTRTIPLPDTYRETR